MMTRLLDKLINLAMRAMIGHLLKQRIRAGSIKAVQAYLNSVKAARFALMGLFGIGAFASVLVAGVLLVIVGGVGLLPIDPRNVAVTILSMGFAMTILSVVGLAVVFSQKRWLAMSKSYELMDAVLSPWPGVMPPNPVDVLRGRGGPSGGLSQRMLRRDENFREIESKQEGLNREWGANNQSMSDSIDSQLTPQILR